jgi:2-C-methyl-D-erythritol 2,4-cyclodiphosphate synthase
VLLRHVVAAVAAEGLRVSNVDGTIVAQQPRLAPHIPAMRALLADDLGVAQGRVNVKATTTEGMGFAGRGEGIAAYAVALVEE